MTSRKLRTRRHAEEGSAYTIALLVMVVLTIFGMTLTMMTQTEVQIAANERTTNRTFYAAESGLHASVARVLAENDCAGRAYDFPDDTATASTEVELGARVDVTPAIPIKASPCPLCQINQGERYSSSLHFMRATARRMADVEDATDPGMARKDVETYLSMLPRRDDVIQSCLASASSSCGDGRWTGPPCT
jgi:hypothetical protein